MQSNIEKDGKDEKGVVRFSFADFFCGIGGFHLALSRLGGELVLACDIDKEARKTYLANHGDASVLKQESFQGFAEDICQVSPEQIQGVTVFCAGFPCQPFSQAGHKRGFADVGRGNLFFEILRLVDGARPKVLFLENVRHLVKHDGGKTFSTIRDEIEKRDYSFSWKIIKASDYGLPQHRARVYMVCFDKKQIKNWADFDFPAAIKLQKTMSDVFEQPCNKTIGFTLRVGGRGSPIGDRRNWDAYLVNGKERRITPKEGKRMMGFPDDFIFPVSDTQAMKQLGNSVAVDAVSYVAQSILDVLQRNES